MYVEGHVAGLRCGIAIVAFAQVPFVRLIVHVASAVAAVVGHHSNLPLDVRGGFRLAGRPWVECIVDEFAVEEVVSRLVGCAAGEEESQEVGWGSC